MRLSGRRGPRTPRSPSDLVVVSPVRSGCARHARGTSDLLKMADSGPMCVDYTHLGHLVFLPSGNAALTKGVTMWV